MDSLPDGVVTFVFSDVEGSTRLAREMGDETWADLLDEHRRLLRHAFSAHGGRIVDTQGDAFFVVFKNATDAAASALEGQRALERHAWPESGRVRVRIGLHTGEAVVRTDHYVGQEVHRASRICDAAHGGQTVVSQMTADLLRENLAADTVLRDLGEHRLKDLGDLHRLFQLHASDLPSDFPRLRSLQAPHNLPASRSSFIGREKEIETIRERLAEQRLVTLTGIGGSGKTRLALEAGARQLANFPGGVFFVELARLNTPDLVVDTMAKACGLSVAEGFGDEGDGVETRLVAALARRRCLLVIDNCEHLLDHIAGLADRILSSCPEVVILATSREALGLDGEQILQVPSLGVPSHAADAGSADAVRLFVDRAQSVKPSFELTGDALGAVTEICLRLDGIPLAIEFAAARIAHLSSQQIASRLEDRFRLLTGGRRRIERQKTLEAALDWSYELLDGAEATLFRRLAVFAGDFSLEAVEAICARDDVEVAWVLDRLAALVAKSLVTATEEGDGEARYRLLETVRMYAEQKLLASGEAESLRSRHRDWHLRRLESFTLEHLTFAPSAYGMIRADIEDIRAAADWCLGDDRPDLLVRLATWLFGYWALGQVEEGRSRFSDVLRYEDRLSREERVFCHAALAMSLMGEFEHQGPFRHADRAIELAGGSPGPFLVVALNVRAFASSVQGAFPGAEPRFAEEARRDIETSVAAARAGLAAEWAAYAELFGSFIEGNLGNTRAAAAWARACSETCGFATYPDWLLPAALSVSAVWHHLLGEADEALDVALRRLALEDSKDSPVDWGTRLFDLSPALFAGGRTDLAFDILREALREVDQGDVAPLDGNHLLGVLAVVEHLRGRHERAGRLFAAARYLGGAAKMAIPFRTPTSVSFYRHCLPLVRECLEPEGRRRARDEGRAMSLNEAVAYAREGLD